jgi:hypothetical protein
MMSSWDAPTEGNHRMETRELYRQKYSAQLKDLGAKVAGLRAQAEKLTVQAKLDAQPHLDAIHTKLDAAHSKIDHLAHATEEKWEGVVKEADHAWHDVKSSVEGAYDVITGAGKKAAAEVKTNATKPS